MPGKTRIIVLSALLATLVAAACSTAAPTPTVAPTTTPVPTAMPSPTAAPPPPSPTPVPSPTAEPAATPESETPPAAPGEETSLLLTPVIAPLNARKSLLKGTGKQKALARDREAQFESLLKR